MENKIISKEIILDEFKFKKESFFKDLLNVAFEKNVITQEQGDYIKSIVQEAISNRTLETVEEMAYGFDEFYDILVHNYVYIISRYLYSMKPSEAIICLREKPAEKTLAKAVREFEKELSQKYFEVEKFMNSTDRTSTANDRAYFREILAYLKNLFSFEQEIEKHVDLTLNTFTMMYFTLDYNVEPNVNVVDAILRYADSFMLECSIREKVGQGVIKKIKSQNSVKMRQNREVRNFKMKLDEAAIKREVDIKIKELEKERKEKLSTLEKKEMLDNALVELDAKYAEFSEPEFEFENSLVDVFVEFICVILEFVDGIEVPKKMSEKHDFVRELGNEKICDIIFSHEENFCFNDAEKEYLGKYLFYNI